jgi:uncharacterized peroxidase-related enzyme
MARISPASPEILADLAEDFDKARKSRGYVANSWYTLARKPKIFKLFRQLSSAVMQDAGEVPQALKTMIAEVVSNAAGCRYCTAHNASNSYKSGVPVEKVEALWQFQTSPLFTPAERAALGLAVAAGGCPASVTDEHFAELNKHFSEDAIVEIVAVISLFGWQNRWNDTMASELEDSPLSFAREHLASTGWTPGVHAK